MTRICKRQTQIGKSFRDDTVSESEIVPACSHRPLAGSFTSNRLTLSRLVCYQRSRPNQFRRIPGDDGPWLDAFRDDRHGSHDSTLSDRQAHANEDSRTHPGLIGHFNRRGDQFHVRIPNIVRSSTQKCILRDRGMVSDP